MRSWSRVCDGRVLIDYDEKLARDTDRVYLMPEIAQRRLRTLAALGLVQGEHILDVGCGSGLLAREMARLVGSRGRVLGIDTSKPVLAMAADRWRELPQVSFKNESAENVGVPSGSFDAATCTQVPLYVSDLQKALSELHRALKPGGRVAIVETDWRGTVLGSLDDGVARQVLDAWVHTVPNPNLPPRLTPLLRASGFSAIHVEAIPIINTSLLPDSFSANTLNFLTDQCREQQMVEESRLNHWIDSLVRLSDQVGYFFCVNRFLFTAVKARSTR